MYSAQPMSIFQSTPVEATTQEPVSIPAGSAPVIVAEANQLGGAVDVGQMGRDILEKVCNSCFVRPFTQ